MSAPIHKRISEEEESVIYEKRGNIKGRMRTDKQWNLHRREEE